MNRPRPVTGFTAEQLIERLAQARARLLELIGCLPADGWLGPRAEHLNPPLWEYGHIVWFQERWCLREQPGALPKPSMLDTADSLYDSALVPHDTRWDLPLLTRPAIDTYATRVGNAVAARLHLGLDDDIEYFAELCLYHELMHIEAWWMAFQYLGYAPPSRPDGGVGLSGQRLNFSAGTVSMGSGPDEGFVFDNEKWRHPVAVPAFDIDASPLGEMAFAEFVDAGGYLDRTLWSEAGWAWRTSAAIRHPLYWRQQGDGWQVRCFDRWLPLGTDRPMLHVNRYEAEACAAWMGRRLPMAEQWVLAAAQPDFRWGMAWEWLRTPFGPYPGFTPDPYQAYSQPWFHTHWELRGGGPHTDPLLRRPGFRNFYMPYRRDPFAGFRTVSPN